MNTEEKALLEDLTKLIQLVIDNRISPDEFEQRINTSYRASFNKGQEQYESFLSEISLAIDGLYDDFHNVHQRLPLTDEEQREFKGLKLSKGYLKFMRNKLLTLLTGKPQSLPQKYALEKFNDLTESRVYSVFAILFSRYEAPILKVFNHQTREYEPVSFVPYFAKVYTLTDSITLGEGAEILAELEPQKKSLMLNTLPEVIEEIEESTGLKFKQTDEVSPSSKWSKYNPTSKNP